MAEYRPTTHKDLADHWRGQGVLPHVEDVRARVLAEAVTCAECGLLVHPDNWQRHQDIYHEGATIPLPASGTGGDTLAEREATMQDAWEDFRKAAHKAFCKIGRELLAIRDGKLYRETHGTFEDYCRNRWGLGQSRVYQLMKAAEVMDSMDSSTTGGTLPDNERQARPLAALPAELRPLAWRIATSRNDTPAAARVQSSVEIVQSMARTGGYIDNGEGGQVHVSEATPEQLDAAVEHETIERGQRGQVKKITGSKKLRLTGVIVASGEGTPEMTIRIDGGARDLNGCSVSLYVIVAKSSTERTTE